MKFREHRGSLTAAMETVVEVAGREELIALLRRRLADQVIVPVFTVADEDVTISPYGFDKRIGWDTHIVHIAGYGVAGFTDGPLPDENAP